MTPVEEKKEEQNKHGKRGERRAEQSTVQLQLPLGMERYLKKVDMMKMCACWGEQEKNKQEETDGDEDEVHQNWEEYKKKSSKQVGVGRVIFQRTRL